MFEDTTLVLHVTELSCWFCHRKRIAVHYWLL